MQGRGLCTRVTVNVRLKKLLFLPPTYLLYIAENVGGVPHTQTRNINFYAGFAFEKLDDREKIRI